jgi:hypothetical protein
MVRDEKTGQLVPAGPKSEPWYNDHVLGADMFYNVQRDRFDSRPTDRPPTDDDRFRRMKNLRETIDLPTQKRDLKRIQAIERARNAKQ